MFLKPLYFEKLKKQKLILVILIFSIISNHITATAFASFNIRPEQQFEIITQQLLNLENQLSNINSTEYAISEQRKALNHLELELHKLKQQIATTKNCAKKLYGGEPTLSTGLNEIHHTSTSAGISAGSVILTFIYTLIHFVYQSRQSQLGFESHYFHAQSLVIISTLLSLIPILYGGSMYLQNKHSRLTLQQDYLNQMKIKLIADISKHDEKKEKIEAQIQELTNLIQASLAATLNPATQGTSNLLYTLPIEEPTSDSQTPPSTPKLVE